ncbi:Hypothetical predicted protein [Pelobates cultripes]|uniref:Uncharacterized protein n=1 Tax=Pelobates cultripes TaxID=61616 RepID=A0AAD1THY8_PELCU|nr:Hypothetical predicted protein [Pelobates cultripes]
MDRLKQLIGIMTAPIVERIRNTPTTPPMMEKRRLRSPINWELLEAFFYAHSSAQLGTLVQLVQRLYPSFTSISGYSPSLGLKVPSWLFLPKCTFPMRAQSEMLSFLLLAHKCIPQEVLEVPLMVEMMACTVKATQFDKCRGNFSETYAALCDYNGMAVREDVQWDVDNIYHTQNCREFRLLDFSHLDTSDVALTVASLSFNQWFTKLSCKDFKLRLEISEQILYMLTKSIKLEELCLENCGLKCDFAIKLAEALDNNPGSVLHTINLSGNQIEDRDARLVVRVTLINFTVHGITAFSRHFEKHRKVLKCLNLSKTSITYKGMNSLFQSLASNEMVSNSLCHLDLSENSGILATEESISLYNFLGHCNSLCFLNLSGTDCALESLFGPLLRSCCSSLSYLNISRNVYSNRKLKDVPPTITKFFRKTSALRHLELSGTKIPPEALRAMFRGLSKNDIINDLHMDLRDCEVQF